MATSRLKTSQPYWTIAGGCDGKSKTRDLTYRKGEDMNLSTPTPIIPIQPRSFISSCRSLICLPNFYTNPTCLREISPVDLAQQRTWPSVCLGFGEVPAWLMPTSRQHFENDFKFALILLNPLRAAVPSSLITQTPVTVPSHGSAAFYFLLLSSHLPTTSYSGYLTSRHPLTLYCW